MKHESATSGTGVGPDFNDVIGSANHRRLVFHDQYMIALVSQRREHFDLIVDIAWVQANTGLIEHVQHADKAAVQLLGSLHTL